ncbi:MAG: oxidoreductase [Minisyncoccia bacterium]
MLKFIDNLLNRITMYRLVLYSLLFIFAGALVFSIFGVLPFSPVMFLFGSLFIIFICLITNIIFASVFDVPTNVESVYITALILILVITPPQNFLDITYWGFLFWASVWSMASKYIFAIGKKHIFNPVAFAIVLTTITIGQSASWWVGTLVMTPFVITGGLLIARKVRRFDMVFSFFVVALAITIGVQAFDFNSGLNIAYRFILNSPFLFFGFIMLTEPLTTPPTRFLRMCYGAICGFLFPPFMHIGTIFSTPEISLLIGNIFSYVVSPKQKLILVLKEKIKIAQNTYEFVFSTDYPFYFKPGQYLEWTLGHKWPDSRGNRRYFTIASSPTEKEIRLGVKFYPEGSSFKNKLLNMKEGKDTIIAAQLAGEFILPKDPSKKLVFMAGGIGVTPFRSMIKYLIDMKQERDIVMFYSNRTSSDIAYKDILDQAFAEIGVKTIYAITDPVLPGEVWNGKVGFVDAKMVMQEVPDYLDRYFYLSGTHGMVESFEKMLLGMGVKSSHINKDFFPGFA